MSPRLEPPRRLGRSRAAEADEGEWPAHAGQTSSLIDPRVVYCGDRLEQLKNFPNALLAL